MRSFVVPCVFLLTIYGCGNDARERADPASNPDSGAQGDGGVEGDGGAGGDAAVDDAIIIEWTDRYGFVSGQPTEAAAEMPALDSVRTLVVVDGQSRSFSGNVQPDGRVRIEGVPAGMPYVLELRSPSPDGHPDDLPRVVRYPIDGARRVRLGTDHWRRQDVTQLANDDDTQLALSVTTPARISYQDTFSWMGLSSYFYRSTQYLPADEVAGDVLNVPEEDALTSDGWTHPVSELDAPYGEMASGLPVASAGDDLLLLQTRQSQVVESNPYAPGDPQYDRWFDFQPWNRLSLEEAVGVLHVKDATFANGTTNLVSGTLSEPPRTPFTIDLQGSSFAQVRALAEYPDDVRISVSLELWQEAGSGPQVYTSVAPAPWIISARSVPQPVSPECFPRQGECPALCCDDTTLGLLDPGALRREFQVPRALTEGVRDLFVITAGYRKDFRHPDTGRNNVLYTEVREARRASGTQQSFQLTLAPVTNLTLDGQQLSWESDNLVAERTPTVAFDAPGMGTPEYYEVYVVELQPDALLEGDDVVRRATRTVATLYGRGTSVTIPENVLRAGRYYTVYVYAVADGRDFSAPNLTQREASLSAGVFSPVFHTSF